MKKICVAMAVVTAMVLGACGGSPGDLAVDEDPGDDILEQFGIDVDEDGDTEPQPEEPEAAASEQGATVQVGDEIFEVEVTGCLYALDFFQLGGIARSPANTAIFEISGNLNEDYDGDGTNDVAADVALDFEDGEPFGPVTVGPADLAAEALTFSATDISSEMFEFTITDNTMTGSGEIRDDAGILIPFGETAPLLFTATC